MRNSALLVLALAAASCTPHPSQQAGPPAGTGSPAPTASNGLPPIHVRSRGNANQPVRISEQQGNRKFYELIARSTESTMQSQGQFRGVFSVTHVTFYGATGRLTGNAPTAIVDKGKQSVVLQDGVHAKTSEGITLTCDTLEYSRATGKLHGSGNVHIVSPQGYTLSGGSFTSDLKLTQVHMQ